MMPESNVSAALPEKCANPGILGLVRENKRMKAIWDCMASFLCHNCSAMKKRTHSENTPKTTKHTTNP
jgi:hypothetical protein